MDVPVVGGLVVVLVPGIEREEFAAGACGESGPNDVGVGVAIADGDVVAALAEALVVGEDEAGDGILAVEVIRVEFALAAALELALDAVVGIVVDGEGAVVVLDPGSFVWMFGVICILALKLAAPYFGAVSGGRGGEGGEGCESERELHRGR